MNFSRHFLSIRKTPEATRETGCLEADSFDRELTLFATANAVPFETLHRRTEEDAPVVDFGSLEPFFDLRAKRSQVVGPRFSWRDGLYFRNQQHLGSCTGIAAGHAFMASNRHIRIHGGNVALKTINPIGAWYKSKGWNLKGGQSTARMAAEVNEFGNVPSSRIGDSVTQPSKTAILAAAPEAAKNQSGLCFFKPTAADVIKFVRSGIACFVGNSLRVHAATTDRNKMRVPVFSGSWAHATAFIDYACVNGTDYVFWLNSWGPIYKTDDLYNAPPWGCWMNEELLSKFLQSATPYGNGVAVFAE